VERDGHFTTAGRALKDKLKAELSGAVNDANDNHWEEILTNWSLRIFLSCAGNERADLRSEFCALLMHRRINKQSALFRERSGDKVAVFAKPTPAEGTEFVSEASRTMLRIHGSKIRFITSPQLNKRHRKAIVGFKMRKEGGNFCLLHRSEVPFPPIR